MFRDRKQRTDRIVAIGIASPWLRLVVMEESDGTEPTVIHTQAKLWQEKSKSLDNELSLKELGTVVSSFVTEENLGGNRIQFVLNCDYCYTLTATGSKEEIRRELRGIEERSALYVAIGPGPKALATSVHLLDVRHEHVLVSVVDQRILDTLSAVARQAGLTIERVESSLVGLSRLIGHKERDHEAPVLILNLCDTGAELAISYRGRLLLDYRPAGRMTPTEATETVLNHLNQLQLYCDKYYGYARGPIKSIFLFGPPEAVQVAQDVFRGHRGLEVHARYSDFMDPHWKLDESAHAGEFAAAMGACLALASPERQEAGPNMLGRSRAENSAPPLSGLLRNGIPVAAALLISVIALGMKFGEQAHCADLRRQLAALDSDHTRTQELWTQIQQAEAMNKNQEAIRQQIQWIDWSDSLTKLAQCAPEELWLNRLQVDATGKMSITGTSFEENSVHEFMSWLDRAPDWERVELVSTRPTQFRSRSSIEFDIECGLTARSPYPREARPND